MNDVLKRNNVKILGEGKKTIVFGHGLACDQNTWQLITPYFMNNYRIVLYDYVGFGKSDFSEYDPAKYNSLYGYVEDLIEIIDAINVGQVIFVGHSVSSMIGLLASIKRPELFTCLVMIGPSPRYINDLPDYYGGFEKKDIIEIVSMMEVNYVGWATINVSILLGKNNNASLEDDLRKQFIKEDPIYIKNFAEVVFFSDHRKELEKATVPTLIIQCAEDSIVPVQVGYYLKDNIKNSHLEVMEAKGHYPHLSQPEQTAQLILNFLN